MGGRARDSAYTRVGVLAPLEVDVRPHQWLASTGFEVSTTGQVPRRAGTFVAYRLILNFINLKVISSKAVVPSDQVPGFFFFFNSPGDSEWRSSTAPVLGERWEHGLQGKEWGTALFSWFAGKIKLRIAGSLLPVLKHLPENEANTRWGGRGGRAGVARAPELTAASETNVPSADPALLQMVQCDGGGAQSLTS